MFGDMEKEKIWYDFIQKKVMELLEPLRSYITQIELQINNRSSRYGDQLKFFDYIYPSISQRLTKLEDNIQNSKKNSKDKEKEINFKLQDYVIAYYGKFTRYGQITDINEKGLIQIDGGKSYFHPNQLRLQGS